MSNKRFTTLPEKVAIDSGDYLAVDNILGGVKKFQAKKILDEISGVDADVTNLKNDFDYNGIGNAFDGVLHNGYWNGSGVIVNYANLDVCNLNKIPCKAGDNIVITADTSVSELTYYISYLNDTTRIQRDTGTGTEYSGKAPAGAKYVCFTFEKSGIDKSTFGNVYVFVDNSIDKIKKDLVSVHTDIGMVSTTFKMVTGSGHSSQLDRLYIPIPAATEYYVKASVSTGQVISGAIYEIYTDGTSQTAQGSFYMETEYAYKARGNIVAIGVYINPPSVNCEVSAYVRTEGNLWTQLDSTNSKIYGLERSVTEIVPELRNGSVLNSGNVNAVSIKYIEPIRQGTQNVDALLTRELPDGAYLIWGIVGFAEEASGMTASEAYSAGYYTDGVNTNKEITTKPNQKTIDVTSHLNTNDKCYCIAVFAFNADGTRIVLREDTDQYCVRIKQTFFSEESETEAVTIKNSQHVISGSNTPLTLLHFSDLHSDSSALSRIIKESDNYGVTINDKICTGDMVGNTAVAITSWWNPTVLTCIGNHDSASYNSSTGYDWTALSMADRDTYYIAPFESNWGITHTSGTSYYYKDYTTQKVRLIVLDGMLYNDNGAEATEQTNWLAGLLSSAITNNLHVIIAIHATHGGATSEECSFSRYGSYTMPTWGDCNTPQSVIDTVASAISIGLKFIGYLVGHTHQDMVWDAENNGKQLMYCVTCAAVSQTAQWQNADMYRGTDADAFNIVTIDTSNTLVKIVRGGGADIDDHMRTRKAICFNYSTGEKVGEVL